MKASPVYNNISQLFFPFLKFQVFSPLLFICLFIYYFVEMSELNSMKMLKKKVVQLLIFRLCRITFFPSVFLVYFYCGNIVICTKNFLCLSCKRSIIFDFVNCIIGCTAHTTYYVNNLQDVKFISTKVLEIFYHSKNEDGIKKCSKKYH